VLAFLLGVQTESDLHDIGRVSSINLHCLGILDCLESVRRRVHGRAEQR
jgi:hypothetical protein